MLDESTVAWLAETRTCDQEVVGFNLIDGKTLKCSLHRKCPNNEHE